MHPARIAGLLQPYLSPTSHSEPAKAGEEPSVLSATQLQSISTYIDILQRWNACINLTAIRNEEEIVTRHFGESLFAALHLFPKGTDRGGRNVRSAADSENKATSSKGALAPESEAAARSPKAEARLADLGSGAGFPGIPIKLWAPNIALTLIESNQKKATFLREVARALTLMDVNIQNVRAETLPLSTFDVVTLRAVERLPKVLPTAASLLAPLGRLALLIASNQLESTRSTLPSLSWAPPIPLPNSQSRLLLIAHAEPKR
jgi:16S rRNA (guanine527-N7)-methyltransferase